MCVCGLCSKQVKRAELWRRACRWVSYAELHADQSHAVDAAVCLAGQLTCPAVTACWSPATRLLQGCDCHTARRQATDAVWTWTQVPRCENHLRSTSNRCRRLGRSTQNCQVDNCHNPTIFSSRHVIIYFKHYCASVMMMMMMMMMMMILLVDLHYISFSLSIDSYGSQQIVFMDFHPQLFLISNTNCCIFLDFYQFHVLAMSSTLIFLWAYVCYHTCYHIDDWLNVFFIVLFCHCLVSVRVCMLVVNTDFDFLVLCSVQILQKNNNTGYSTCQTISRIIYVDKT